MLQDFRLAMRRVIQAPLFSLSAILILGVGVGTVAAMGSILYALAWRPLNIPNHQSLVAVSSQDKDSLTRITALAALEHLRTAPLPVDGWCAYNSTLDALEANGRVVESNGELMTGNCPDILQVAPILGRWFTPDEAPASGPGKPVVIITPRLWRRLFDQTPDVLGATIRIQNMTATVIGVMPENYTGLSRDLHADYILPFNAHRPSSGAQIFLARLRPEGSIGDLRSRVQSWWPSLLESIAPASPSPARAQMLEFRGHAELIPQGQSILRRLYTPIVTRLTWLAIALFALVCLNIGGMMVSRVAARSSEIATMRAIGAKPFRIVRQLSAECALLAMGSVIIAIPTAYAATLFTWLLPIGNLQWDLDTRPDLPVLVLTVAASVVLAIAISALPAAMAARYATNTRSDRTVTRSTGRWARALLITQVAATVIVVFAAALMLRSFANLRSVDRGYVPERLLSLRLSANPDGYRNLEAVDYYSALVERVSALPGVEAVGLARYFGTLSGTTPGLPVGFSSSPDNITSGFTEFISPGFFSAAGIPLVKGRDVAWTDLPGTPAVAVVSESLARVLAPDGDVLGRVIRYGTAPATARLQIVGVVGNTSFGNLRDTEVRAIYVPAVQARETASATVHVRTLSPPSAVISTAVDAIAVMGREHVRGAYVEDVLFTNSIVAERMAATVATAAATIALAISCVGLFALMSHNVHRRTREIGIRMAVGATPTSVATLVIGDGFRLAFIGVAVGLPLAVYAGSSVRTLLFGITATDEMSMAGTSAALLIAAAIGAMVPALRAVRVDPVVVLRAE